MSALAVWLVVEYAVLGILAIVALVGRIRQEAAWRKLMIYAFTRPAVANLEPPTMAELRTPDWMTDSEDGS